MAEVIEGAETYQLARTRGRDRIEGRVTEFAQAIAHAVMFTANHMDVEAIVALTESGSTPLYMSRIRSDIPIFAFTRHERTQRRVALYRGVYPIPFDIVHTEPATLYRAISKELLDRGLRRPGRRADPDAGRAVGRLGRDQHHEAAHGGAVAAVAAGGACVTGKFEGTERYVATEDLMMAVNAAVTLARPLLVKGEPGTGKTQLAEEIALALGKPLYRWHIKSTTKAQHGLYEYDAVSRLRDSQLGEAKVHDIGNYIVKGRLWEAFDSAEQAVLLIDEIDKADIEFPNDLLLELDRMEFFVYETRELVKATQPPDRGDHQQQREGTARRVPAPLLLPLHPLPGRRDDDAHRRGALPAARSASCLRRR